MCPLISGPYFPVFGPEITPYWDSFHAVTLVIIGLLEFYKKHQNLSPKCSIKKLFLEISQHSQENTCARVSFLIKLEASGADSGTGVFL